MQDSVFIRREFVLYFASWLNKKGVTLKPERYKQILLERLQRNEKSTAKLKRSNTFLATSNTSSSSTSNTTATTITRKAKTSALLLKTLWSLWVKSARAARTPAPTPSASWPKPATTS
jgi:hypothetical protein